MHKTVEPFGASAQTLSAPAKVAPEVMPTKIPSFFARSWLQRIASAPAMRRILWITPRSTASPVSFGMKSGLDAEGLGHRDDQRVAFLRADHREADPGVAARRLDDGLAGLQVAALLGRLDDPERQPVFDRAQRVERLDLDVKIDARRRDVIDANDRRVADGFENALIAVSHSSPFPGRCPAAIALRPRWRAA